MLSAIGLILIIAGWIVEIKELRQSKKILSQKFLALYAFGVLLLAYDSYKMGLEVMAFLNSFCFLAAGLALFKNK